MSSIGPVGGVVSHHPCTHSTGAHWKYEIMLFRILPGVPLLFMFIKYVYVRQSYQMYRDVNEARHYEAKAWPSRPRPEGLRPRPNHQGQGRKVYRYGRVNDSCNYVTYFGYVAARTQLSGKNIILNDRPSPRPNTMQVVNEFIWASALALFHSRLRPLKISAEARPRGLTSL